MACPLAWFKVSVGMVMGDALDREDKSCTVLTTGAWGLTKLALKATLGRCFETKPLGVDFVLGQMEVLRHII